MVPHVTLLLPTQKTLQDVISDLLFQVSFINFRDDTKKIRMIKTKWEKIREDGISTCPNRAKFSVSKG